MEFKQYSSASVGKKNPKMEFKQNNFVEIGDTQLESN